MGEKVVERQRQIDEELRSLQAGQGVNLVAQRQELEHMREREHHCKNELKCLREERALAAEHRRFQRLEEEMVNIRKELGDKEQRIAALENCRPNAPILEAPVTKPMQVQADKKVTPPPPPPAASGQSPFDLRNSLPSVRALVATFE